MLFTPFKPVEHNSYSKENKLIYKELRRYKNTLTRLIASITLSLTFDLMTLSRNILTKNVANKKNR